MVKVMMKITAAKDATFHTSHMKKCCSVSSHLALKCGAQRVWKVNQSLCTIVSLATLV